MGLQKREKILAVATGGLLLVAVAAFLLSGGGSTLSRLRQDRDNWQTKVRDKEAMLKRIKKTTARLAAWEKRALPADEKIANSLYLDWLRELAARVLRRANVDPSDPQPIRGAYWKHRFTILARGTLEQLTRFLHEFYSTNHLHQIRRLSIKPDENSAELHLAIFVEALSLPGADRKDTLSTEPAHRLKLATVDDYLKTIVRRKMEGDRYAESGGLFAAYVPPRPAVEPSPTKGSPRPPEPKPPGFDLTKHTYVTAITERDGKPQVWMTIRPTGESLKKFEGDLFKVGQFSGTVEKIDLRCVTIAANGQRCRINLGSNLDEATKLAEVETPDTQERGTEAPDTEEPDIDKPEAEQSGAENPDAEKTALDEPARRE